MRDWAVIALGVACLLAVAFLAHSCGGGGGRSDEPVPLSPEDRSALEAAARAIAEAAGRGDAAVLDAAITPDLPQGELHAIRSALAALRGKQTLEVLKAEGLQADNARVTLQGGGATRTWYFDRGTGGTWTLSGV